MQVRPKKPPENFLKGQKEFSPVYAYSKEVKFSLTSVRGVFSQFFFSLALLR